MFSVDFHARGSSRHARNGDPEKVVTFAHRNDLLGGHVTFNKLSIDHCCVAGRESWSNTEILLDRAHVGFYMINDGEDRFVTFSVSARGRLLAVSHTERGNSIRIISARLATNAERQIYEEG